MAGTDDTQRLPVDLRMIHHQMLAEIAAVARLEHAYLHLHGRTQIQDHHDCRVRNTFRAVRRDVAHGDPLFFRRSQVQIVVPGPRFIDHSDALRELPDRITRERHFLGHDDVRPLNALKDLRFRGIVKLLHFIGKHRKIEFAIKVHFRGIEHDRPRIYSAFVFLTHHIAS